MERPITAPQADAFANCGTLNRKRT